MAVTIKERQEYHEQQRRKAINNVFKGHCSIEDNYSFVRFSKFWMTFYTAKAVICLLLRRNDRTSSSETIAVCMWDYWEGGCFEADNGWKELEVGYGVLQNWHYRIIDNSNY